MLSWENRRKWLAVLFVLIGLSSGLRLVYATPMGQVPDEPSHIARAAALLHGEIVGHRSTFNKMPVAGVDVDDALISASLAEYHNAGKPKLTAGERAQARGIPWSKDLGFDISSGSVEYFPFFYIPGAIGIGIGHVTGLGPLETLYLGRVFMLLGFLILGASALWVARVGSGIFFMLLSLPETMSLAASFNQDGMLIAACALAAALLTRDPMEMPARRWLAASIVGLVLCSKPPYGLLIFCAALPIIGVGAIRRIVLAGLFGIPALVWVLVMMHTTFVPRLLPAYHPGPLWPGNPAQMFDQVDALANVRVLLHRPSLILSLPYDYITTDYSALKGQFIGRLGWLDVQLPPKLQTAWAIAIFISFVGAVLGCSRGARRWNPVDAIFVLTMILTTIIAICIAFYLSWTPVGATMLGGVQGRYFLLLVPFLPLTLPRLNALVANYHLHLAGEVLEFLSIFPIFLLSAYDIHMLPILVQAYFG